MRLPRPHIPIATRIKVAKHQLGLVASQLPQCEDETDEIYLDRLLNQLSFELQAGILSLPFVKLQLDHDPALCNREFNKRTGKYKPDANDPCYLVYRTIADHDTKTRVRGDGAQLSDLALRRKFKRIEKRKKEGKR